jgi:hypothetical protein
MIDSTQHAGGGLGNQLTSVQAEDGTVYVPLKRLCESLGIDYERQRSKVRNSQVLNAALVSVPGTDGRHRKMLCLPLEDVGAWASTIDPGTLRPEVVEALRGYLEEPDEALEGGEAQGEADDPRTVVLSYEDLDKLIDSVVRSTMKMIRERIMKQFYWSNLSDLTSNLSRFEYEGASEADSRFV